MSLYIIIISAIVLIVSVLFAVTLLQRKAVPLQEFSNPPLQPQLTLEARLLRIEKMLTSLEDSVKELHMKFNNSKS